MPARGRNTIEPYLQEANRLYGTNLIVGFAYDGYRLENADRSTDLSHRMKPRDMVIYLQGMIRAASIKQDDGRDPWGNDPCYPRADWQHEVAENNTSLGYWEWVDAQREAAQGEAAVNFRHSDS